MIAHAGGRASARETIGRVAAGAVAEKWLKEKVRPILSFYTYTQALGVRGSVGALFYTFFMM